MAAEKIKAPITGALRVEFEFVLPRPKGHYGTGKHAGQVKSSAPLYPGVKPDITKLIRSTEDAMKGIAWKDDSQVVTQIGMKRYSESPGALITISCIQPSADLEATELQRAAWRDMVRG